MFLFPIDLISKLRTIVCGEANVTILVGNTDSTTISNQDIERFGTSSYLQKCMASAQRTVKMWF